MTNIASKEILARLLAQENIDVVHENTQTASFNVATRVLSLPMWEDMENFTYDHLVGHEVGHALFTPAEGWTDEVKKRGDAFKSFFNVVEDARIEKLIQRRFPGLRRSFVKSYQKMMNEQFFGADVDTINDTYELIDRLNVLLKCGESVGVRIEADEQVWVDRLRDLETIDDALQAAIELFEMAQRKSEEKQEQEVQVSIPDENGEEEDNAEDSQEMDANGNEAGSDDDESDDSDERGVDTKENGTGPTGGNWSGSDEPIAKTDSSLEENIRDQLSQPTAAFVRNVKLNEDNFDKCVVSYKQISGDFKDVSYGLELFRTFQVNNKKQINYLVKEFEMKKRASEYARTTTAKSGVIDTVKMNNYRFSDDIFSRINVIPEGKNHGLLMYVDWSGSMYQVFEETIHQLLNLVMFCRQVNIPFRVFGFTDRWNVSDSGATKTAGARGEITHEDYFALLELFNSKMNRQEFQKACAIALLLSKYNGKAKWMERDAWFAHVDKMPYIPRGYGLGGTPLDSTVAAAIKIHKQFQKTNRLDIVNAIFLTDGEGSGINYKESETGYDSTIYSFRYNRDSKTYITSNKKRYVVDNFCVTNTLMEIYREQTGANLIGIRIMDRRVYHGDMMSAAGTEINYFEFEDMKKNLRKERWLSIDHPGYSKGFLILSDSMATSNGEIEVADDASKAKIKSAFSKSMGKKLKSRKMLTEFIEMIA